MTIGRGSARSAAASGVTLIELLIAITIVAMMSVSIFACFDVTRMAQDRVEANADAAAMSRAALRTIMRDFRSAYYAQSEDDAYAFVGEDGATADMDTDSVQFVCATNDPLRGERPTDDLCQVTYLIDTDEKTPEKGLVRLAVGFPVPEDEDVRDQYTQTSELLPNAESLQMLYYDDEEGDWVEEWTDRPGLPAAVKGQVLVTDPTGAQGQDEPQTESLTFVAHLVTSRYEEPGETGSASAQGEGLGPGEASGATPAPGGGQMPGFPSGAGGAGGSGGPGIPGMPNLPGGGGGGR